MVGIGRDVRIADLLQTRRGRVVLQVGSLVLIGIPLRNWRSPGARIVGIEMVDAHTGGPLTIRSVVISDVVGKLFAAAVRRVSQPLEARSMAAQKRVQDLAPEMAALQREHAGDRAAEQKALMAFYKANGVNPLRVCPTKCVWFVV